MVLLKVRKEPKSFQGWGSLKSLQPFKAFPSLPPRRCWIDAYNGLSTDFKNNEQMHLVQQTGEPEDNCRTFLDLLLTLTMPRVSSVKQNTANVLFQCLLLWWHVCTIESWSVSSSLVYIPVYYFSLVIKVLPKKNVILQLSPSLAYFK